MTKKETAVSLSKFRDLQLVLIVLYKGHSLYSKQEYVDLKGF